MQKVWHMYTVECYSALKKNVSESVLMRRMNLEPVQGGVSQKDKHWVLMHVSGILKDGSDEPIAGQPWRRRLREQTGGRGVGGRGWDGLGEERGCIYRAVCGIDSGGRAPWLRELKHVLGDGLEGWVRWEVGGRLGGTGHTDTYVRDMCAPVADSCWQKPARCCKANIFQKKM